MDIALQSVALRHAASRSGAAAALDGLSFAVARGEAVAVIGPSGAGKTTLLHVLAAALRPTAGRITLGGQDPWALPVRGLQALRGRLFLAPQVPPLPPRQRVVTAVLAGRLPAMGLWRSVASLFLPSDIPAAHEALASFDLADKLFERVDRLSGGERQRVALARALLAPASLWLVDEPLAALDPTRAQQATQALLRLARERGVTLVASLHQVDVALAQFPRVIGLRDGRIAFDLPPSRIDAARIDELYASERSAPPPEPPADEPAALVLTNRCR